jgi:hypothetical protein
VNTTSLHPPPRFGAALAEQLRAVGLAVRGEIAVAALLMAATSALLLAVADGADFDLVDMVWPTLILGFFAPMGVWKGEGPSRRAYLRSMPVPRGRHTLAKVFGGWAWLMGLCGLYLLWALSIPLLTGGHIVLGPEWERVALAGRPAGSLVRDLTLHGHPWMWLVPFTGATIAYLFGSVAALAAEHPWRWFAGLALTTILVGTLSDASVSGPVGSFVYAYEDALFGRYGLWTLARGTAIEVFHVRDGDEIERIRKSVPHLGAWLTATALWGSAAVAGVLAAALRHRDA